MSEYYLTKDELYHHGIKGQKWGLRRFQNDDGSLTTAGRERYGYGIAKKAVNFARGMVNTISNESRRGEKSGLFNKSKTPRNADGPTKTKMPKNAMSEKPGKVDLNLNKTSLKEKFSDPKVKKAIKVGAAVAATALVAYGAYKIGSNMSQQKKWNAAKEYGKKYYSELAAKNLHKMDVYSNELKTVNESVRKIYGSSSNMPTNSGTYKRWENAEKNYMNAYNATRGASSKAGYYGSGMYGALSSHMKKHN